MLLFMQIMVICLKQINIHKIFNISGLAQIDSKTVEDIFKGVLQTPDPAVQPPPGKSYAFTCV